MGDKTIAIAADAAPALSSPMETQASPPSGLRSPIAVKLTANETEALRGLLGSDRWERFYTFKGIANNCGLAPHLIRRTVRALARKGLAEYSRGLWTDHGEPAGAGYALTKAGQAVADSLGMEAPYDC